MRRIPGRFLHRSHRSGVAFVYAIVMLVVLLAICSLAVDYGQVQLVKTELQRAADAASRAAAGDLSNGVTAVQNTAVSIAAANTSMGQPITIDPNLDVEFLKWDDTTRTYTVLSGSARSGANAVRVYCRKVAARGTAVPLSFARVLGRTTCDVNTSAVANAATGADAAFVGLTGVTAGKALLVASYTSEGTTPPPGTPGPPGTASKPPKPSNAPPDWHGPRSPRYAPWNRRTPRKPSGPSRPGEPSGIMYGSRGSIGSNGLLKAGTSADVEGQVILGPSGSWSAQGSATVTGGVVTLPAALDKPDPQTGDDGPNPWNLPRDLYVGWDMTLPGGVYYVTNVTFTAPCAIYFSDAAVIYISGKVDFYPGCTICAADGQPTNLQVYQTGTSPFGNGDDNVKITAVIEAPNNPLKFGNNCTFYGSAVFGSITVGDYAHFFYDETLGAAGGATAVFTVK